MLSKLNRPLATLTALGLSLAPLSGAAAKSLTLPDNFAAESLGLLRNEGQNTLFSPSNLQTAVELARAGLIVPEDVPEEAAPEAEEPAAAEAEPEMAEDDVRPTDETGAVETPEPSAPDAAAASDESDAPEENVAEDGAPSADKAPSLGLKKVNAVWLDHGVEPTANASAAFETVWGIEPVTLDISADGRDMINAWVDEATEGRITSLIEEDPGDVSLYLTSALLYKGAWAHPFDPAATENSAFTLADGSEISIPMMHGEQTAPVWSTEAGQYAVMGFTDGLQMLLFLPATDAEQVITVTFPEEGFSFDDASPYRLVLPSFDLSNTLDLTASLEPLGVRDDIAEGLATLTTEPQRLGPVVQAVTLLVDEEGAEAAAATAIAATRSLPLTKPEELRFDRPFDVYLYDPATGETIVAAHIADPRG